MNVSLASHQSPVTSSTVRDFITLMKPGVMSLVVFTGLAGMLLAQNESGIALHPLQQFMTLLCIALASGAGAAINMWYDRDIDAVMLRTAARPVPAGRIASAEALTLGLFMAVASILLMGLALNWQAAALLGFAIFFYAVIYTMWLKRSTPQNIVIGGAAGAFPPMIGWVAVTGNLAWLPLLLFAIIFLWTPPHFWALALYRNSDYSRAHVPMMPVIQGAAYTKRLMFAYTLLLTITTLLVPLTGHFSLIYTLCTAALDAIFLFHITKTLSDDSDFWPRKSFLFSIAYLFILFAALMADSALVHFVPGIRF